MWELQWSLMEKVIALPYYFEEGLEINHDFVLVLFSHTPNAHAGGHLASP